MQLRLERLAVGCKCGGRVGKVGAELFEEPTFEAVGNNDFLQDPQSRMQYLLRLHEEGGSDVFGKAVVDVLMNKVKGRVGKGQRVPLEDLHGFRYNLFFFLTTTDQGDFHSSWVKQAFSIAFSGASCKTMVLFFFLVR